MFLAQACFPAEARFAFADRTPRARACSFEGMSDPSEDRNAADARLLQRTARGDHEAFSELYDRFSRPLYALALRILGDAREAEDIVQDVFLALWEKSSAFSAERGTAFSWAATLARNRAIDRVRMRRRRGELLDQSLPSDLGYDEAGGTADSTASLTFKEKARGVRTALAALPAEQQKAVELAFFSGLTQQQIAEQLREPLSTVKARIRRGLLKLRDALHSQHD
jgi:RNA polymerase sigma-70 factor, ECF subfamily